METFDLIVIGSGPGGYVAAIRAAQLGMRVAVVEKDKSLGGTCLNVGCIPSKALLHSSELYDHVARKGREHGIFTEALAADLGTMMQRKEKIVKGLTEGIAFLFKKNKITSFAGSGKLLPDLQVSIDNKETIQGKHILLATGSEPTPLPFLPFDETSILSSTGALALDAIPKTLLVVGAGVIGLELGSVYRRLGSKVIFVEMMDRIAPTFDRDISTALLPIFKKEGMEFYLGAKVKSGGKGSLTLEESGGKEVTLQGERILVAIGRRPYSKNLGLEELGIAQDKAGRVIVDGNFRTNIPGIYAIGDLIDGPMLAHKASEEGVVCVERLAGHDSKVNYLTIPNVMYTFPEVASVGMSEEEARSLGLKVLVGRFPFAAIGRARCLGETAGFVKVLAEEGSGRLLGLHIVGPNASEMIAVGAVAIAEKMGVRELGELPFAHPTLSEAIKEAALATLGRPLHA